MTRLTRAPHAPGTTIGLPDVDYTLTPSEEAAIKEAMNAAWSTETRRAYEREWRAFVMWCERTNRQALPAAPKVVAAYLTERAYVVGKSALTQAKAIIGHMHTVRLGVPSPAKDPGVQFALRGVTKLAARRRPERPKAPLTLREIQKLLRFVDATTLGGRRDAALLLMGFATAMRRSELVAMEVAHCTFDSQGAMLVTIPFSKTDQEGHGQVVAVKHWCAQKLPCPICTLREWAFAANITSGPIFRGVLKGQREARDAALDDGEVSRIVKRYAERAKLDPDRFGGHSLRAGFVTEAFRRGLSEVKIMGHTRHKSLVMLARYRREADPVAHGAADLFDAE